jgi:hypothetical protein
VYDPQQTNILLNQQQHDKNLAPKQRSKLAHPITRQQPIHTIQKHQPGHSNPLSFPNQWYMPTNNNKIINNMARRL